MCGIWYERKYFCLSSCFFVNSIRTNRDFGVEREAENGKLHLSAFSIFLSFLFIRRRRRAYPEWNSKPIDRFLVLFVFLLIYQFFRLCFMATIDNVLKWNFSLVRRAFHHSTQLWYAILIARKQNWKKNSDSAGERICISMILNAIFHEWTIRDSVRRKCQRFDKLINHWNGFHLFELTWVLSASASINAMKKKNWDKSECRLRFNAHKKCQIKNFFNFRFNKMTLCRSTDVTHPFCDMNNGLAECSHHRSVWKGRRILKIIVCVCKLEFEFGEGRKKLRTTEANWTLNKCIE